MPGETRVLKKPIWAALLIARQRRLTGCLQRMWLAVFKPAFTKGALSLLSKSKAEVLLLKLNFLNLRFRQMSSGRFRLILASTVSAATLTFPGYVYGQERASSWISGIDPISALPIGIFGGAITFALLSAFWLIRERAKAGEENLNLRSSFADVRADRDRLAALTDISDQCIVVWKANQNEIKVLGSLASAQDLPQDQDEFLSFETWLKSESAIKLRSSIDQLREAAKQFTIIVTSKSGKTLEAQGRVSGGYAFVRLLLLDGVQADLARVSKDFSNLHKRFGVLEALFEKMPSPFWITNQKGELAYVNPAYAHAVDANDQDRAMQENRALFDSNERQTIRKAIEAENYFLDTLPAVIAGDRKLMELATASTKHGIAGIAVDRSDVNEIKTTLKHTVESHQHTFDHLATAIAIFDQQQRLQFHNSSFQHLWEFSDSDLDGHPSNSDLLEVLRSTRKLPETPDWKKWKEGLLSLYRSTQTREESWHLPDGRTLRVIINPQNAGGTSWVFENVTEELALKSNYNSLMRMQGETLDHLSEAVAVFGANGKIKLTNPAFLSLWDIKSHDEIEGQHIKEMDGRVNALLDDPKIWEKLRLAVTSLRDDRDDLNDRIVLNNGRVIDYHLVYLPAGQSMLTFSDVTAAANVERVLKERNDALEESDALKSRFLQHVSYELRAPLTSIAGFTEMLTSNMPGKLNEKQGEYLQYIADSSDILKAMIDDILDLATIDAGAMMLELDSVNLDDLAAQCIDDHDYEIRRFALKVDLELDPTANGMIADGGRIYQILQKLVANALQATPDGSTVTIRTQRLGDKVEISVEDEGETISPEARNIMFERFESGKRQNKKRGSGLGLALVKSLVELHGGSVSAEDRQEKGMRIVCLLPFAQPENRQAAE